MLTIVSLFIKRIVLQLQLCPSMCCVSPVSVNVISMLFLCFAGHWWVDHQISKHHGTYERLARLISAISKLKPQSWLFELIVNGFCATGMGENNAAWSRKLRLRKDTILASQALYTGKSLFHLYFPRKRASSYSDKAVHTHVTFLLEWISSPFRTVWRKGRRNPSNISGAELHWVEARQVSSKFPVHPVWSGVLPSFVHAFASRWLLCFWIFTRFSALFYPETLVSL